MRGGKLTGRLHVALQIPELPQGDLRDIHNVRAQRDRGLRVIAIGAFGGERLHEPGEVLVQSEQAQQLSGRLAVGLRLAVCGVGRLFVLGDGGRVEDAHGVDVDGDASAIAPSGEPGILQKRNGHERARLGISHSIGEVVQASWMFRRLQHPWCHITLLCRSPCETSPCR